MNDLREFLDASPDAIVGFDPEGRIVLVNSRSERLFGRSATELLERPIRAILPGLDLESLAALRQGVHFETAGRRGDGGAFPARVSFTPVGASLRIALVRDASDQKRAEQDRVELLASERAARSEAERANLMKDEFLATLSHELRTPLNAMLGWTQILRTATDAEVTARAVETIERNIRVQAQLIEDLLDVSRIVSGKLALNVRPVELAPLVEAALATVAPAAANKGVELRSQIDPDVATVAGDAPRLQQVVWNLLSNAVKFTPKDGRIDVSLRQVGSLARIEVADTGTGIEAAFLPHVFDRFRQSDASESRSYGGLGLGLAIVRSLVELHGGTVRADSAGPGAGATFVVLLPVGFPAARAAADPEVRQTEGTPRIDGIRVLAVDDSKDSLGFLRRVLEDLGATVFTATSAAAAMEAIARHRPDVILCDVGMPVEDGYQFIQRLRAIDAEQGGQTPAAALTAYTRERDRQRALELGYQLHVPKPVEARRLAEVILLLAKRA